MTDILDSDLYNELVKNPRPCHVPYLKRWGPIISRQNIKDILEKLMVDYLIKKQLISTYYDKYKPNRTEQEQMEIFEKDLNNRIGKQAVKMEFVQIMPDANHANHKVKEQLEKITHDTDFEEFLI